MAFKDNIDIVKFFRALVYDLKTHAASNGVNLSFQTKIGQTALHDYDAERIKKEISQFLKQVILYVPDDHKVTVLFDLCEEDDDCCLLTVSNTGVNLYRILSIPASTKFKTTVNGDSFTSCEFIIKIPLTTDTSSSVQKTIQKNRLKPYYAEMGKRLAAHFSKPNSFLPVSLQLNRKENAFLQKINVLISTKLEDNTFTVEEFADQMALSRSQLFRKMKALTNMSPQQYLLYFRLHAAKELLEARDLDLNIADACYSTGFMSKSHFSRSFKKQFGLLPSQIWR